MFKKSLAYNQSFVIVISFIYVHFHIITIFIGFTNFGCSSITFVFFGTLAIFKVYNILNPPAHISSVIGPVSSDTEVREDMIQIIASKLHKLLHKRFKINLLICAQLQSTLALRSIYLFTQFSSTSSTKKSLVSRIVIMVTPSALFLDIMLTFFLLLPQSQFDITTLSVRFLEQLIEQSC